MILGIFEKVAIKKIKEKFYNWEDCFKIEGDKVSEKAKSSKHCKVERSSEGE